MLIDGLIIMKYTISNISVEVHYEKKLY